MNKATGPYKQRPGRGDMPKTGANKQMAPLMSNLGAHQDHDDPAPSTKNKVVVGTADAEGNRYDIEVSEGSGYHQLSKKFNNFVPNAFRAVQNFTKSNDPFAKDRTPERRQQIMDSVAKQEMKTWGANMYKK